MERGMEAELVALFNELEARLAEHDDQRKSIQTQIESECVRMRAEIDALEDKINSDLQSKFASEDKRLQVALNDLREILARGEYGGADAAQCVDRARAELLVTQSYNLSCKVDQTIKIDDMYSLSVTRSLVPKTFSLERRKVDNLSVVSVIEGRVFLRFDELFNPGEVQVLKENGFYCNDIKYVASCKEQGAPDTSSFGDTLDMLEKCFHPVNPLKAETNYALKVRVECNGYASSWSDEVVFVSSKFSELSAWRHCPKTVDERFAYVVSPATPRIATRLYGGIGCWSTVVGNVLLPENKTLKWSIRLLKSRDNGRGISVGVAPFDVPLNAANNGNNCGWYFDLCTSILRSGPPHHYSVKKYKTNYSPKKKTGVEVLMNTTTGDLSFSASGKDPLGVAYQGIPLDKPLVPCVLLYYKGDSIELVDPVLLEEKGDNNNKDDKDNIKEEEEDKDKNKNDNDDNNDNKDNNDDDIY